MKITFFMGKGEKFGAHPCVNYRREGGLCKQSNFFDELF